MVGIHAGDEKALGFFTDQDSVRVEITEQPNQTRAPDPLGTIPDDDPSFPGEPLFLTGQDEWFVAVQQVLPSRGPPPNLPPVFGALGL